MANDVFALVGQTIDNTYAIRRVVGEGGFGVVYEAHDQVLAIAVAIKCLKIPPHFAPEVQAKFYDKFVEEARLLARLNHPSIVRIYRFGQVRGAHGEVVPYLAMEWLQGQDLEHAIGAKAGAHQVFTEAEALQTLMPVVEALSIAHADGIAHRDIKPANIYLMRERTGQTRAKILDFGIAKVMQEGETATQVATKTSSGFAAFSPQFGAPEQFHSKRFGPTGPWTDVHAMGIVFSAMLTGRVGLGDDHGDCFVASTNPTRPTPRAWGARVSDGLESVLAKAVSLQPTDRFAHASELLTALRSIALVAPDARLISETEYQAPGTLYDTPGRPAPVQTPGPGPTAPMTGFGGSTTAPYSHGLGAQETEPPPQEPEPAPSAPRPRIPWLWVGLGGGGLVAVVATGIALSGGRSPATSASASQLAALPSAPASSSPSTVKLQPAAPACPSSMVKIAAGSFWMGTDDSDAPPEERPSHQVKMPAFCIGKTEVTVKDYNQCVSQGNCVPGPKEVLEVPPPSPLEFAQRNTLCNFGRDHHEDYPANCVGYDHAEAYCKSIGGRLPTESEWEYAARGSDGRRYAWGVEPDPKKANLAGKDMMPVGSFASAGEFPNGLLDMAGNVSEWTSSYFSKDGYGKPEDKSQRVCRGASFADDAKSARVTRRDLAGPKERFNTLGFRCVVELPEGK